MTGRLLIEFRPAEGAVSRLLGLVERRGFRVRGLSMTDQGGAGSIAIDLEARDSGRRLDVLSRQIGRLAEVLNVSSSTPVSGTAQ